MKSQSEQLNLKLQEQKCPVYSMLSTKGKNAFFPKGGILEQSAQAKGKKYNATMGQAFDKDGSPLILDSFATQLTLPKELFLYSSSHGNMQLREIWQKKIYEQNPSIQSPISMPIVTGGITHGIYLASQLFLDKGDQLIIPDKLWGNYNLIFEQAEFNVFPFFNNNGFNIKNFEEKLSEKGGKKIVLLNFPHNPTGYSLLKNEVMELTYVIQAAAEKGQKIIVICDDAYFGLGYEQDLEKESIFAKLTNAHENILAIKVDGITKECYAWGARVGFMTYGSKGLDEKGLKILEEKTAGMVRQTISNVCTHSQFLAINALSSESYSKEVNTNFNILKDRYIVVQQSLKGYEDQFKALPFNSGYFMCVQLKHRDAEEVRLKLLEHEIGVIAIGNLLRIAYSSVAKEKIPFIFEKMYQVCKEMK